MKDNQITFKEMADALEIIENWEYVPSYFIGGYLNLKKPIYSEDLSLKGNDLLFQLLTAQANYIEIPNVEMKLLRQDAIEYLVDYLVELETENEVLRECIDRQNA